VCGGPHFKRDCPTRKEGNSNHSGASGNSGSGRKFNYAAKANARAAGQQAANVENIQCASPAVQEGSDAQTRRCEFMSEVMTPPPLMAHPDYGTPSSIEGVDSFNVTAADHCAAMVDALPLTNAVSLNAVNRVLMHLTPNFTNVSTRWSKLKICRNIVL
jgi:hypothetical protein